MDEGQETKDCFMADNKQWTRDFRRQMLESRLKASKSYQMMVRLTQWMDRYHLDALVGLIPGWGDAIALLSVVPFVYFSLIIIRSVPLTLAVLNNALRDVMLGLIPFFVGDIIDIFHRSNIQNMRMIQGFVEGDEAVIKRVNRRALQSVIGILLVLLLIGLLVWLLVSLGSEAYRFIIHSI